MSDERLQKVGSKLVHRGPIASVRMETFQYEDGSRSTRQVVVHPGAVCVIPHDGRTLFMVEQPREAVEEPALLELPAGKLDVEGETPLECAQRELAEEISKAGRRLARAEELLHEPRLRQRARLALPGHRALRRAGRADAGGADRAGRDPAQRPGRRDRALRGRQVADRAAPAEGSFSRQGPACAPGKYSVWPPSRLNGLRIRSPSERYEALVLDFLAHLEFERGLSRNTLAAYRTDLLQFGRFLAERGSRGDRRRARRTSPISWRTWHRATATDGPPARPRPSTARRPACAPSTATCAARRRSRTIPPARLETPRRGKKLPEVLSYSEVQRLLAQPRGDDAATLRDRALLELMYASGLRASETISLEISDVDLEHGIVRARGKGSKERLVPGRRQGACGGSGLSALAAGRRWCARTTSASSSSTSAADR